MSTTRSLGCALEVVTLAPLGNLFELTDKNESRNFRRERAWKVKGTCMIIIKQLKWIVGGLKRVYLWGQEIVRIR